MGTAAAITMGGGSVIAMDGGSGNRQQWRNGRWVGEAITMGNGLAVVQWMAQWAADDCPWMRGQRLEQCLVSGWLVSCEIWVRLSKNIQVRMTTYMGNTYYFPGKITLLKT